MATSTDRPVPLCLFVCLCHSSSAEEVSLGHKRSITSPHLSTLNLIIFL